MKIESLWRYPAKSMGGEQLDKAILGERGIPGDRQFAIHDGTAIRGAKKFSQLMSWHASYTSEKSDAPELMIRFEDGSTVHSTNDAVNDLISKKLNQDVRLDHVRPASDASYYLQKEKRSETEMRAVLGLLPVEEFPDFSKFPPEVFANMTPPGTFFDAYPILVLTTASLNSLQKAATNSIIDVRRFRPNILLDMDAEGYPEQGWEGCSLAIGDAVLSLHVACPRCVMTTIGFDDLPKDPSIMRALVKENHHNLGIYASVAKPGEIKTGETVRLIMGKNSS